MANVLVFDRLSVKSWAGSDTLDAPKFPSLPLAEALELRTPGELLIVGYGTVSGDLFPRLNKAALCRFPRDPEIQLTTLLVDIDYEEHQVPPDDWHEEVLEKCPFPCNWYRTPHGMRLFWPLEETVDLIEADSAIAWTHKQLNEAGIQTDLGTTDWTRMQRCPHALGLDLPKSDFSQLETLSIPEEVLSESRASLLGDFVQRERPGSTDDITRSMLSPIKKFDATLSEDLYRGTLSAVEGERHSTLLETSLTISFLYESNDPLVPYQLLAPSCESLGKGLDELWRICEWTAAAYDSAKKEEDLEYREAADRAAKDLGCRYGDVKQRVILDCGREYFVWDEAKSSYSEPYTNQRQILAALKLHAPVLAGEVIWAKEPVADILRDFSSPLHRIIYSYEVQKAHYHAQRGELLLPTAKRDPSLTPTYSEPIDEWLQALFGPDYYDKATDWLAAAPRLDRPICALYIRGANSVGKGMLTLGMARIWSPYLETTSYSEIVSNHQETLLKSPLIVADEKVSQNSFNPNDSAVFRRIIGNGSHSLNPKHKTPVTLLGFPRVLITANNEDALNIREDLDQDDLDAVRLRVGYVDRGGAEDAKNLLQNMAEDNEFDTTYDMTTAWVQRGIAEHILWLEENHEFEAGNRFLVEGWESDFTRNLVTAAGSAGVIAETLVLAIEKGYESNGIRYFDGFMYVNDSSLAKEWRTIRGHEVDRPPRSESRLKALRSLAEGRQKRIRDNSGRQKRYWAIQSSTLARLAEDRNLADYDEIAQKCARPREEEGTQNLNSNVIDLQERV